MKWFFAIIGHIVLQIVAYYSYHQVGFEKTLIAIIIAIGLYVAVILIIIKEKK